MTFARFAAKFFSGAVVLTLASGCVRQPSAPPEFPLAQFPAAPQRVAAALDSGVVKVTWRFSDSLAVRGFQVYRQEGRSGAWRALGASSAESYRDAEALASRREYGYSVSAVALSGNEGPRSAPFFTSFEFDEAPASILLLTPIALDTFPAAEQLAWTSSLDSTGFAAYQIYRANTSSVTNRDALVATVTQRHRLTHLDAGLKPNELYSYRVYVYTRGGGSSASNTVSVRTSANLPPQTVTLAQPVLLNATSLRLTWSRNTDKDFASYRILRATSSPVTTNDVLRAILNEAASTTHDDIGLTSGATYFYRIAVYDRAGAVALSNEVSATLR